MPRRPRARLTGARLAAKNACLIGRHFHSTPEPPYPVVNLGPLNTLRFLLQHPLTMHQPLAAVGRYLRWQIGSRVIAAPIAVDFVNDARLLVRPGMTGATGNIYAGLHEFEDMAFMLHVLRAEDLFVDVGANVGTYTVLAAKVVGARVVAFEPIPSTGEALRDNIALNAVGALVEVHETCVGAASGTAAMTTRYDTTNHVVPGPPHDPNATLSVPVEALDDVLVGRAAFLLKLDVEGYELEALRGASRTLAEPTLQCVIMEINDSGERYARADDELLQIMSAHGFVRRSYSPRTRRLEASHVGRSGGNALFVKDHDFVQQRVESAPRFRVLSQEI